LPPGSTVRRLPVALVQHFHDDGLLSLDAKRIDRVQQINADAFRQLAHQREDLIEIRLHLECSGSVIESLSELPVRNISVRDENQRFESSGARIGGHRCRCVAGRNAGYAFHAQAAGLRDSTRHSVILERSRGIETLMLENQPVESAIFGGGWRGEQRRVPFAQEHDDIEILQERDDLAISPDAALIEWKIAGAAVAPD
jgi:hypothetical protein